MKNLNKTPLTPLIRGEQNSHFPLIRGIKGVSFTSPSQRRKTKGVSAFTLVELIIVITILAILATIAFTSFQNFSKDARDGNRVATLKNIETWLNILFEKTSTYPDPTDYELMPWDNIKQWSIWDDIKRQIWLSGKWTDPLDDEDYVYSVDMENKKYKLWTYLEELNEQLFFSNTFLPQSYAEWKNYTNRYFFTLWERIIPIFLKKDTKEPANKIENYDENDNETEYIAQFTNSLSNGSVSWSWDNLKTQVSIIQSSCLVWTQLLSSWQQTTAYTTSSVAFWENCVSIQVSCNKSELLDTNWNKIPESQTLYNTCSPTPWASCEATSHIWHTTYTITPLSHDEEETFTWTIPLWQSSIKAKCYNSSLTYTDEQITCDEGKVYDDSNKTCNDKKCTWDQPENTTITGEQEYGKSWSYWNDWWTCKYVCNAWYYWDGNECIKSDAWYYVATSWQETQTACSANTQYQDETWKTSCKEVGSWYYSTPAWNQAHTWQTQCEINHYCQDWVKTACPEWTNTNNQTWKTNISDCQANVYTVSGTITNGNGATINICGKQATVNTDGTYSVNVNHGTNCASPSPTLEKTNYNCTISTSITSITKNETIDGSCTPNNFTITYAPNSGTLSWCTPTTYTIESATITPTCTTKTRAWYTFSSFSPASIATGSSWAKTITANWTANNNTISIDENGWWAVSDLTYTTSTSSQTKTLTQPTRTNYTFSSWSITTQPTWWTASISSNTLTIPANVYGGITLKANWTPNNFTITYAPNSGTLSWCTPTTYTIESATITPTCTTKTRAWYTFSSFSPASIATGSSWAKTITANWTLNNYTISSSAWSNWTVSCTPNPVNHWSDVTCTASPEPNYEVDTWTWCDSISWNTCNLTNVIANKTVSVSFKTSCPWHQCLTNGYYIAASNWSTWYNSCAVDVSGYDKTKCILRIVWVSWWDIYVAPSNSDTLQTHWNSNATWCTSLTTTCSQLIWTTNWNAATFCTNLKNTIPPPVWTNWFLPPRDIWWLQTIQQNISKVNPVWTPSRYWSSSFHSFTAQGRAVWHRVNSYAGGLSYNLYWSTYGRVRCIAK